MADEADLADGYAERIVEQSLFLLKQREAEEGASHVCTFCEEFPVEVLPNGIRSMLCARCLEERQQELMAVILPVSVVDAQGDGPEDSWQTTQLPSLRYRKNWYKRCPI